MRKSKATIKKYLNHEGIYGYEGEINKLFMSLLDEFVKDIKAQVKKLDYVILEDGSSGYDEYISKGEVLELIDRKVNEVKTNG